METSKQLLIAEVNLDTIPVFPFPSAIMEEHKKGGQVIIEKRADDLYIDGVKVFCDCREDPPYSGSYYITWGPGGKKPMNACILDFLMEYQEFIPENWKGHTIPFMDTIFLNPTCTCACFRILRFFNNKWEQNHVWTSGGQIGGRPCGGDT